jgi:hypothetical protein
MSLPTFATGAEGGGVSFSCGGGVCDTGVAGDSTLSFFFPNKRAKKPGFFGGCAGVLFSTGGMFNPFL